MHELILLYGPVTIFICESMRGGGNFGKKASRTRHGGGGYFQILPSRDLWMIPNKAMGFLRIPISSNHVTKMNMSI